MSRLRAAVGVAVSVLAIGAAGCPIAHGQPLPGGSATLPPIEPVGVPVPAGSTVAQLPALPYPFHWLEPAPPAPRYVASNWVEPRTWCPAPNQWAYGQDGTKLWCVRLQRTDGYLWAPHPTEVPWTPNAVPENKMTAVGNSLGGKTCSFEGETAIDPSNGQPAYCGLRLLGGPVLVWMYSPGS